MLQSENHLFRKIKNFKIKNIFITSVHIKGGVVNGEQKGSLPIMTIPARQKKTFLI